MRSLHDMVTSWWKGELGGVGTALDIVSAPVEVAYAAGVAARNALYDTGALHSEKLGVPVVSIGNIAIGGSGKTPVTAWIARALLQRGARPAVLHGGYAADEPALHAEMNPGVPVFVGRDRIEQGRRAVREGANILLLDDAFQHRRIIRDVDIVLVAAETWSRPRRTIPRGPWREDADALRRAHWIAVTRRTASREEATRVRNSIMQLIGNANTRQIAMLALDASTWRHQDSDATSPAGTAYAVTAIAAPEAFVTNARAAGARIERHAFYPDHHEYTTADAEHILSRAHDDAIVTTAKDWVKLRRLLPAERVWVLDQRVVPEEGAAEMLASVMGLLR